MQGFTLVGLSLLYHAGAVLAGNTTSRCLSGQLDWYTNAVGETPCMTYQRLRQICNNAYEVGDFALNPPGDNCNDQVVPGTYTAYLASCGASTNQSALTHNATWSTLGFQQAVCNENIKIDNFLYNRSYWTDGSCRWTADYAVEQQAINDNNTFTVCPNQASPSASLPASTTVPPAGASLTSTSATSALSSSSGKSTSQKAIIGGAAGGAALAMIAVLGGVYCYRRGKRPRMIQDTPSMFLGQYLGAQPVYGVSSTDTEPVATQRYRNFSLARRNHGSRKSTLPMIHVLSPERAQSSNTSTSASYLVDGNLSEAAPCDRENDAGTKVSARVSSILDIQKYAAKQLGPQYLKTTPFRLDDMECNFTHYEAHTGGATPRIIYVVDFATYQFLNYRLISPAETAKRQGHWDAGTVRQGVS
ncbi:hypothetical protein EV702DRAFT_1270918 [Suillus placidus]|uniref:Uncharacterized protein n=1 Tax=Suillus placidus TaxID=48579 RepID=A0A9P7CYF4_9AGAM|nr:hypothetical protein EV702DRAFT_1270918 [Suillus placidus]